MKDYFVDLHVHIGTTSRGKIVKYASSKNLTFKNIAIECLSRKGIDMVGIVDCASPGVIEDVKSLINTGEASQIPEGGIIYKDKLCIIPGTEIETSETGDSSTCGGHTISFFPTLNSIVSFSAEMSKYIKNINLSSQRAHLHVYELQKIVEGFGGILIPAHIFSPHKGYYGNCVDSLYKLFKERFDRIIAIELGLSADTYMADKITELSTKTFLSNSDAHSLPKIAREYNLITMNALNYNELICALKMEAGRKIKANYGLDPKLGKYHRTYCEKCNTIFLENSPKEECTKCESKLTVGVFDRIETIKDKHTSTSPEFRPPYIHQIPLEFIPGLGEKMISKLLIEFDTEMNILHFASQFDLERVVRKEIAQNIIKAREGKLAIQAGGGGIYGKIE